MGENFPAIAEALGARRLSDCIVELPDGAPPPLPSPPRMIAGAVAAWNVNLRSKPYRLSLRQVGAQVGAGIGMATSASRRRRASTRSFGSFVACAVGTIHFSSAWASCRNSHDAPYIFSAPDGGGNVHCSSRGSGSSHSWLSRELLCCRCDGSGTISAFGPSGGRDLLTTRVL